MIDEETQHSCKRDIEYLQSLAHCQIKEMKRCSQAVLSNADKISYLQSVIDETIGSLRHQAEEARQIAGDVNLISNLKGDVRRTNNITVNLD